MWYEPALVTRYAPRRTISALWRQYHDYGFWRAHTVAKHRAVASWRHLAPPAGVAGLTLGLVCARTPRMRRMYTGGVLGYAGVLAAASIGSGHANDVRVRIPIAAATMHARSEERRVGKECVSACR